MRPEPAQAHNSWIEVDCAALADNARALRRRVGDGVLLAPVVKSNAYGHGAVIAAGAFLEGGADWLCVHELAEAEELRAGGVGCPLLVLGPLAPAERPRAVELGLELTVATPAALAALAEATPAGQVARVHLKVETGTHRQGMTLEELAACLERVRGDGRLELAGLSSHFANIEDTTRHRFAHTQRERFAQARALCADHGLEPPVAHMASSAATLLFPETHHDLVRPGIAAYGFWPSRETLVSAREAGLGDLALRPALRWLAAVREIKDVPAGSFVGYGCSWKAEVDSRIAVLGVGYADGYRRALSGQAHVLVRGRRCPVRGRVCMNLLMVDVSHLPGVEEGEEVVLLGRQGDEEISAEDLAAWMGTIHYEMLAGLSPRLPRAALA